MRILLLGFLMLVSSSAFSFGMRFHFINSLSIIKDFGAYKSWSNNTYAKSCAEYKVPVSDSKSYTGAIGDGTYRIQPTGFDAFNVYCDMTTNGGGWTLISSVSATNRNHHSSTTDINISSTDYPIPYENVQAGRKLSDDKVKALAAKEKVFMIEMARNKAKSGADLKYVVYYKLEDLAQFSFANVGGTASARIFVSYSFPYNWESPNGASVGYNFGCSSIYKVFDAHGAFGTACSNGTTGSLWLSSGYTSNRMLYGYGNAEPGIYGGSNAFSPNNSGNPGYTWVR